MAQNIVEIARGLKDDVVKGVLLQAARQSQLMQRIPFDTTKSFLNKLWEQETITEMGFRSIGNAYSEVKDSLREVVEGIALMGGQVDIDRALMKAATDEVDEYTHNLLQSADRFRYKFTDEFINGDLGVDPDGFNGLKKRVADFVALGHSDALVAAASASTGLELNTSANRQTFLDVMEEAEFNIEEGSPDLILTSKKGFLTLSRVARREGLMDTTRDQFDREIPTFRGTPIMFAGTKGDQTTEIITSSEDPGDGGNDATSFYFVKFGERNLAGLQMNAPEKIYDQVVNDGVTHRVVWEWPVGLHAWHRRSIVRVSKVVPNF